MNIDDLIRRGEGYYNDGKLQEAKGCFLSIVKLDDL